MKNNRIIALLLASLMCTSVFTACGNKEETKKPDTEVTEKAEGEKAENTDDEGLSTPDRAQNPIGLNAYDWKYKDDEVMMTIGGHPITFDIYRAIIMPDKEMTDMGDTSYWTDTTEMEFKDSYLPNFKSMAAIANLAKEKGITLTDEDYKLADDHIQSYKTAYGEEGFDNLLAEIFLNEDIYRKILEYDLYSIKLLDSYSFTEEEIIEHANNSYVHVQHVLVSTIDEETGMSYTGEKLEEKKKLAEEIALKAKNGEDFYSLVEEYGEDPGMENNPDGYTFTYGEMVPEFEEMSFKLEVGAVSEPVETSYGLHIIKKLPLEVTPESDAYAAAKDALASEKLTAELAALSDSYEIEYTDAYNKLTMINICTLNEDAIRAAEIIAKAEEAAKEEEAAKAEEESESEDTAEADKEEAEPEAEEATEAKAEEAEEATEEEAEKAE